MNLDQPIPKLCTLVTASPFDAAIHDAFAKCHQLNCYLTYGADFMSYDLAHYLAPQFKGEYPSQYLLRTPKPWLWCNHSVGASGQVCPPTMRERLSELRRELNTLVAMAHHRTGRPHGAIHQEVRTACGGPPTAMATVEQLEQRITYLRSQ